MQPEATGQRQHQGLRNNLSFRLFLPQRKGNQAFSTVTELPRNINTKLGSILSFVKLHGQMTSILAVSNDDPWRTLTHDDVAAIPLRNASGELKKMHNMQHEQHPQLRSKMSRLAAMSPQASW